MKLESPKKTFTKSEDKIALILYNKLGSVVSRDEIGEAIWGIEWLDKYSDWAIDELIHKVRGKLSSSYSLKTIRNRGFVMWETKQPEPTFSPITPNIFSKDCTTPTKTYLKYMNDNSQKRKVYSDLFWSLQREKLTVFLKSKLTKNSVILAINSFSTDNVVTLSKTAKSEVIWTNFDENALEMTRQKIKELGLTNHFAVYDDINNSRLAPKIFDVIINDFRLNFNLNHSQNVKSINNMFKLLKCDGLCLVSVVVDARYDNKNYGTNQQKAPLNLHAPWEFVGPEKLPRKCFSVPYYKKLFKDAGFKIIAEFDMDEGINFAKMNINPIKGPSYRRYLLSKS